MRIPHLSKKEFILLGTSSDEELIQQAPPLLWEDTLSGETAMVKRGMSPVLTEPLSSGGPRC